MKKIPLIILIVIVLILVFWSINKLTKNSKTPENTNKIENINIDETNTYDVSSEESKNNVDENVDDNKIENWVENTNENEEIKIEGLYRIADTTNLESTTYYFSEDKVAFETTSYYVEGTYKIEDNKIEIRYEKSYLAEGEESNYFPNGRKEELTIINNDELTIEEVVDGKRTTLTYKKAE